MKFLRNDPTLKQRRRELRRVWRVKPQTEGNLEMAQIIRFFPLKKFSPLGDRGVSLIIALLILLVLTIIGISAISTTTYETNIAGNERLYNYAFYCADAGIDYFYGRSGFYTSTPTTQGVIHSNSEGIDLGGGRFTINWRVISVDLGPPVKREFLVVSEGIAPNFPVAGRVTIEAVIEGAEQEPPPEYPGGST